MRQKIQREPGRGLPTVAVVVAVVDVLHRVQVVVHVHLAAPQGPILDGSRSNVEATATVG